MPGAEWDAFMDDFHQTLAKFGVPERERGELDAIVESTKDDIVTSAAPAARSNRAGSAPDGSRSGAQFAA